MFDWETMLNLVQASLLATSARWSASPISPTRWSPARSIAAPRGSSFPASKPVSRWRQAVSFAKYPPLGRRGAGGDARYGYVRRDVADRGRRGQRGDDGRGPDRVARGRRRISTDRRRCPVSTSSASVPRISRSRWMCMAISATRVSSRRSSRSSKSAARHGVATGMVEREPAALDAGTTWACASCVATTTAT